MKLQALSQDIDDEWPESTSHTRRVRSNDPVTACCGVRKTLEVTFFECPNSVRVCFALVMDHKTLLLSAPVARIWASEGEKHNDNTAALIPRRMALFETNTSSYSRNSRISAKN